MDRGGDGVSSIQFYFLTLHPFPSNFTHELWWCLKSDCARFVLQICKWVWWCWRSPNGKRGWWSVVQRPRCQVIAGVDPRMTLTMPVPKCVQSSVFCDFKYCFTLHSLNFFAVVFEIINVLMMLMYFQLLKLSGYYFGVIAAFVKCTIWPKLRVVTLISGKLLFYLNYYIGKLYNAVTYNCVLIDRALFSFFKIGGAIL